MQVPRITMEDTMIERDTQVATMSLAIQRTWRGLASAALASAVFVGATIALMLPTVTRAQAPMKWESAAPFPEPSEELYGVAANGKMYVIGGFGKEIGMVYEYDSASDKWTKKKPMPRPAHHAALAEYNGKIYAFGGFVPYSAPGQQRGGGIGWQPIDNAWQYDPAADSWKALAPLPTRRGSALAAVVDGKIYVIGGATMNPGSSEPAVFANRPARSVGTNEQYDPETNKWESRSPMPTARNHTFGGAVNGKIYIIGGRLGSAFIGPSSNTDLVEEYDPATDQWGAPKAKMPTPRSGGGWAVYNGKIYVAGGEVNTPQMAGAFRALEAYDPASNTWAILPGMPNPRHGVAAAFIGNRLHLVSGKITSGGYAPGLQLSIAEHDVLEIPNK
jgi:N-acetylneuraminic acid mutarotase